MMQPWKIFIDSIQLSVSGHMKLYIAVNSRQILIYWISELCRSLFSSASIMKVHRSKFNYSSQWWPKFSVISWLSELQYTISIKWGKSMYSVLSSYDTYDLSIHPTKYDDYISYIMQFGKVMGNPNIISSTSWFLAFIKNPSFSGLAYE